MQLSEYDRGFRFKKNVFTVAGVIDRHLDKRLFLEPDYIYSKPWPRHAKSTFIESLLLGMPTGEFWCEEDNYGAISVLDGTQRLQCLLDFCDGEFALEDLRLLPDLENSYYSDLPSRYTSILSNRAELSFTTISYDTHPALKFEFFKRINSDSYRFPVQAARNFAFRDHFVFIRALQEVCSSYLQLKMERSSLTSKNQYLHSASFDEMFLLLCGLTLTFSNEISTDKENVQELLDDTALHIHFSDINANRLMHEVRRCIRTISRHANGRLRFDPVQSLNRSNSADLYDRPYLTLTINQITNLYIHSLRGELNSHTDLHEIIATSSRAPRRNTETYYRRLFSNP